MIDASSSPMANAREFLQLANDLVRKHPDPMTMLLIVPALEKVLQDQVDGEVKLELILPE